jgi:uncharacterized protein YqgC (DUF456 family)
VNFGIFSPFLTNLHHLASLRPMFAGGENGFEMVFGAISWEMGGAAVVWAVTICLLIIGLIGCVVPIIPGHVILLVAAIVHRVALGESSGIRWWSFVVLTILLVASQAFEFFSGAAGTKWFGGSKWGAWGALAGGIVGMFFFPFGLLLGPLIGSLLFEKIFAKKENKPALVSGVGSVIGTVAGMVVKLAVGLVMSLWIVMDALEWI